MGQKIDSYVDQQGNTIQDDDLVVYQGDTYKVKYISFQYVNLQGLSHRASRWLHLSFSLGVPTRLVPNASKKQETDMTKKTDLSKITTPFGLLSKEVKDMLQKQKGATLQFYNQRGEWVEVKFPTWDKTSVYRVKPEPREWWVEILPGEMPTLWGRRPDLANHKDYIGEVIHVREVVE